MNLSRWRIHFAGNRFERPEPEWGAPAVLVGPTLKYVRRSIEQFQLGDGGGPACLVAYDAAKFQDTAPLLRPVIDAWFAEEREHSRLLGGLVDRLGGRRCLSHWSFSAFCFVRRWSGVAGELQILLLTELVSTVYYRLLRRHCPDRVVHQVCTLILRDESGHVAFHGDRLAARGRWPGALWRAQFIILGFAAATMLWINHRPAITALGGSTNEFFREVRRELGRFLGRLARNQHAPALLVPSGLRLKSPGHE